MTGLLDLPASGPGGLRPRQHRQCRGRLRPAGRGPGALDGSLLGTWCMWDHAAEDPSGSRAPCLGPGRDDRPNLALRARDLFVGRSRAGGGGGPLRPHLEKAPARGQRPGLQRQFHRGHPGGPAGPSAASPWDGSDLLDLAGWAEGPHQRGHAPGQRGALAAGRPPADGAGAGRRSATRATALAPGPAAGGGASGLPAVHGQEPRRCRGARTGAPPWISPATRRVWCRPHAGDRARWPAARGIPSGAHRAPLVPGFHAAGRPRRAGISAPWAAALRLGTSGVRRRRRGRGPGQRHLRGHPRGLRRAGLESRGWVCAPDPEGARVDHPPAHHPSCEAHP